MTTEARPSPRERLLETAAGLSYEQGVGVGIDALCRTAGVSKRSMYQLFASKDELLAASLERGVATYAASLLPAADDVRGHRERILHVFEQSPSRSSSRTRTTRPAGSAAGGARAPDLLARQLILVFDGASARAGIGADDLAGS